MTHEKEEFNFEKLSNYRPLQAYPLALYEFLPLVWQQENDCPTKHFIFKK
ncbi:MAG: hypothetical protein WCQ95_07710 [Bacteroidota bacterium]